MWCFHSNMRDVSWHAVRCFQRTACQDPSQLYTTLQTNVYIPNISLFFFFLSLSLLIGWQLSICNCCKPFFSLLYNCITVFLTTCFQYCSPGLPTAFFFPKYCSFKDVYYKLVMPNCMPYPWVASIFKFLKVIFLPSPFERLQVQ